MQKAAIDDLLGFIADRLKVHLRGEGISHDVVNAVFAWAVTMWLNWPHNRRS